MVAPVPGPLPNVISNRRRRTQDQLTSGNRKAHQRNARTRDVSAKDINEDHDVIEEKIVDEDQEREALLPLIWAQEVLIGGARGPLGQYSLCHPRIATLRQLVTAQENKLFINLPTGKQLVVKGKACCNCIIGGKFTDHNGELRGMCRVRKSKTIRTLRNALKLQFPEAENNKATRMAMHRFLVDYIKALCLYNENPKFGAALMDETTMLDCVERTMVYAFLPTTNQMHRHTMNHTRAFGENIRRYNTVLRRNDRLERFFDWIRGLPPLPASVEAVEN